MLRFDVNISFLFRELPLLERFDAASKAGFKAVEILSPEDAKIDDINIAAKQAGVKIVLCNAPAGDFVSGGPGLSGVPGRETAFREAVAQVVEMAHAFSCPSVHISPSRVPKGEDRDACLSVLTENLHYAADSLQQVGTRVLLEPLNTNDVPDVLIRHVEEAKEVIAAADHPNLGLQFDIYHMAQMEADFIEVLKDNIEHIKHIQFADTPGRGEPGSGELDFSEIFSVLDSCNYEGWLGAEYIPTCSTPDSLDWFTTFREFPSKD